MSDAALLERLKAHRTIGSVPQRELQWLADVGHLRTLHPGEILSLSTAPVAGMYIVLDGHLSIRVDRGAGPHIVMEWRGGDVTGLLPYSRMHAPPGNVVAEETTDLLMVDPPDISRMIGECHELTSELVHVMLDRARVFKSSELHDEKMASLGRLAAGLAHELNNPASAVARGAQTLIAELDVLEEATKQFCALNLSDAQCLTIAAVSEEHRATPADRSPLDVADREDAIADWLEAHGVSGVEIEPLAKTAVTPADLDAISASVGVERMGPVLSQLSARQSVRRLASEISTAASRIHSLVAAVKGFTYMDQQATLKPIAIGRGLSDTITVLGSKARSKSVNIELHVPPDLPNVDGYGGELNQVWANLLDNAIDATPRGHVHVNAAAENGHVVVRVIDDGPGIPADVVSRVFDPFFTTKGVGEGTGIGLDIAQSIVRRHRGEIDFSTGAGGTEFRVTLPVSTSTAHRH
jgi:signal transduction histidine kinase